VMTSRSFLIPAGFGRGHGRLRADAVTASLIKRVASFHWAGRHGDRGRVAPPGIISSTTPPILLVVDLGNRSGTLGEFASPWPALPRPSTQVVGAGNRSMTLVLYKRFVAAGAGRLSGQAVSAEEELENRTSGRRPIPRATGLEISDCTARQAGDHDRFCRAAVSGQTTIATNGAWIAGLRNSTRRLRWSISTLQNSSAATALSADWSCPCRRA